MYLALIPDEQTTKALRAFAPALPSNAHCTIIHSKAPLPAGLPLPEWRELDVLFSSGDRAWSLAVTKLNGSFVCAAPQGVSVFGGKAKVRVLKLALNVELDYLRAYAVHLLAEKHIVWSSEWAFSPHVTLGGADAQLVGEPPAVLRFNCMEWRP